MSDLLTQEFVLEAIAAEKQGVEFPINFDNVWEPLGYTRKDNAKRRIMEDLEPEYFISSLLRSGKGGASKEVISLSVDGFKHFCLMARTTEGRYARTYFIEVEKAYRQDLELKFQAPAPNTELEQIKAELAQLKKDHKKVYDKMQFLQAKSMGSDMLTRLQNHPDSFSELEEVTWLISGIADKYYFRTRCEEDLIYGEDYVIEQKKLKFTPHAALKMILNFRSRRGVASSYLPEKAEINVKALVNGKKADPANPKVKTNRRSLQP